MGLDSYIFKTTKGNELAKMREIKWTQLEGRKNGIVVGDMMLFIDDDANYMDKLDYEIHWRKFSHVTAWILSNVFENKPGNIQKSIGIITKEQLKELRNNCRKILESVTRFDGMVMFDAQLCKSVFPTLDEEFFCDIEFDERFIYEFEKVSEDIARLFLTCNEPDTSFIFFADF